MGCDGAHYRNTGFCRLVPHGYNKYHHNCRLELFTNTSTTQKSIKMGYEDSVYLAKLAEQAERYEGEYSIHRSTAGPILMSAQKWWRT